LIINVYKPLGITSFDVVRKVRKASNIRKVGHAGTLDPFASGVLLMCIGPDTKKNDELMELMKEYEGVIHFGITTDTYDCEGVVTSRKLFKANSIDMIERVCSEFVGEIQQIPPMYSAVKQAGVPLYRIARKGKTVERKPKNVTIYSITVLNYTPPFLSLRVLCSKGTYIRTLAYDIGQKLGCGAYLKMLTRTRIGNYSVYDSLFLGDLKRYFEDTKKYGCCG